MHLEKVSWWLALSRLFKLKQTGLLVFTGLLGYLIASHWKIDSRLLVLGASLSLAISGTTGLNMFFDRDIDSLMFRTRHRPLPAGTFPPGLALLISSLFLTTGLILGWHLSHLAGLLIFSGFLIDLLLYTILLKRRTSFGLVVGALAGGMPIAAGYSVWSSRLEAAAIILFSLVAVWSLAHIWLIAAYYRTDYLRASLPVLSVTAGEKTGVRATALAILVYNLLVFLLWRLATTNFIPFVGSMAFSLPLLLQLRGYLHSGLKIYLKRGFKFLNPLLGITLLLILFSLN